MHSDLIEELQALTERLWARAGLGDCVQIARERHDDGSPHIEVVAGRYDIVVRERGRELQRIAGLSLSDTARWFLFGMAVAHAQSAELGSRSAPKNAPALASGIQDDGYSRWNWMAPTVDTMSRISSDLGDWTLQEFRRVLSRTPLAEHEKRNARYPLLPAPE
ncbi:hypothetical protein GAO09_16220 [Rhizobiales bacterium RZME27]|jgi:hypothetical protein|uniref:Immunity protein 63 domain-containing protein n=1 Tax=Endobacterium cereale TaxID=2663029 RepID=A0A6A8AFP4_9HYPH|nr:hypothetical protein [Endobacterium cereale]MEB2847000.1 hypothetical protein [Endobacterium cereale]MQY47581.1 hypothetical protein [Endobacterium cereale]